MAFFYTGNVSVACSVVNEIGDCHQVIAIFTYQVSIMVVAFQCCVPNSAGRNLP